MLLEMTEPPTPAVWPAGIDSRDYIDGQDERPVHETMEASFADHCRHVPISFEQWLHWNIEHQEFDPLLWAISLEDNFIVGALVAWPNMDGDNQTGFHHRSGCAAGLARAWHWPGPLAPILLNLLSSGSLQSCPDR